MFGCLTGLNDMIVRICHPEGVNILVSGKFVAWLIFDVTLSRFSCTGRGLCSVLIIDHHLFSVECMMHQAGTGV